MKCIVIYFSVTGNTAKVARAIQTGVKKAAGQCDIARIHEINPYHLTEYDLIGLGSPIWGFTETVNVKLFIKNMTMVGGKHAFAFATHGTCPQFFFPSIVPKLKRRGLEVIGMYNCYADVFMLGSPDPYPTGGHPDEIDLKEAETFGYEVVERSRRISAGETGLIPQIPEWADSNLKKYIDDRNKVEERLGVKPQGPSGPRRQMIEYNKDKCNYPKCHFCMDICPVYGIDLTVQKPIIAKPCIGCGACTMICPTRALTRSGMAPIQAPSENTDQKSSGEQDVPGAPSGTVHRWQVLKSYYLDPLVKAEAEGRFRRLVPVEQVGWENPLTPEHEKYRLMVKNVRLDLNKK